MSQNFIRVNHLHGELIMSHLKGQLGASITTKEIYFQKPHQSYHILIKDILSIIPIEQEQKSELFQINDELQVKSDFSHELYKVEVAEMIVINRNGRFLRTYTEIILPLSKRFLEKIYQHTDLTYLPTH